MELRNDFQDAHTTTLRSVIMEIPYGDWAEYFYTFSIPSMMCSILLCVSWHVLNAASLYGALVPIRFTCLAKTNHFVAVTALKGGHLCHAKITMLFVAAVSALLVDLLSTSYGYESIVVGRNIGSLTENRNEQRNGWKPLDTPHLI